MHTEETKLIQSGPEDGSFFGMYFEYVWELSRYCPPLKRSKEDLRQEFAQYFECGSSGYLIYAGDILCGFVIVCKPDASFGADIAIEELFIVSEFRRRGIASEALRKLLEGKTSAVYFIFDENLASRELFRKLFGSTKERPCIVKGSPGRDYFSDI